MKRLDGTALHGLLQHHSLFDPAARHAMPSWPNRTLQRDGGIGLPDVSEPEASSISPSARGPDGPAPFLLSDRAANLFSSTGGGLKSGMMLQPSVYCRTERLACAHICCCPATPRHPALASRAPASYPVILLHRNEPSSHPLNLPCCGSAPLGF